MALSDFFQSIYDSSLGTAIRESGTLFPIIETVHVLSICTVVGTIAVVDLRLMGLASHRRSAQKLLAETLPITVVAFVIAVLSGLLMFSSHALEYTESVPFLWKMGVIALAGLNMAFFHLTTHKSIARWSEIMPPPPAARLSGAISLSLWVAVLFLGRWIGFAPPMG